MSKRIGYVIDSLSTEKALMKHKIDSLYGEEWKWNDGDDNDDNYYEYNYNYNYNQSKSLSESLTFQFIDKWIEKHDMLKGKRAIDLYKCLVDYKELEYRIKELSKENKEDYARDDYDSLEVGVAFYDKKNRINELHIDIPVVSDDPSFFDAYNRHIVKYNKSNFIKEMLYYRYTGNPNEFELENKTIFKYDKHGNLTEEKVYHTQWNNKKQIYKSKFEKHPDQQMEYKYQTDNNKLIHNIGGLDLLYLAENDYYLYDYYYGRDGYDRDKRSLGKIVSNYFWDTDFADLVFFALQNEQKYLPVESKGRYDERIFNWTLDENGIPTKVDIVRTPYSDEVTYEPDTTTLIFHW